MKWQKFYGKDGNDIAQRIIKSSDGNLIIGGTSEVWEENGQISKDVWIIKLDPEGQEMWDQSLYLKGVQELTDMSASYDGGVVFTGLTRAGLHHLEKSDPNYRADFLVGKLDSLGEVEWVNSFGGNRPDQAHAICKGLYKEFVVTGGSHSSGSEEGPARNFGQSDIWLLKLDDRGKKRFSKVMGASQTEWATAVYPCANGDYLVAGFTNSPEIERKNLSLYGNGLLIRLSQAGNTRWIHSFPCPRGGYFSSLSEAEDGTIRVGGKQNVKGKGSDFWWLKLSSQGRVLKEKLWGTQGHDEITSITAIPNGSLLSGRSEGGKSKGDFWIFKLNEEGEVIWKKTFGGNMDESAADVIVYSPDVYYAVGEKVDYFSEKLPRQKDFWLLKIEEKNCDSLSAKIFVRAPQMQAQHGRRIRFRAISKYADRYLWKFGDGTSSTLAEPLKSYKLPGMYKVQLSVWANKSCKKSVRLKGELQVH